MATQPFTALGHQGSDHYVGLETFPNPGVASVRMTSDEFTALCPITGQPDYYTVDIYYEGASRCIESKSLKLYLMRYRNEGAFVEALAVKIKNDVIAALEGVVDGEEPSGAFLNEEQVEVTLTQVPRGGIEIEATA